MGESNDRGFQELLKSVFWIGVLAAMAIGAHQYQGARQRQADQTVRILNDELRRGRGDSASASPHEQVKHARITPR
jgi:hypothetical protein